MKRGLVILVCVSLVLVLSLSIVSAGFLRDLLGQFFPGTGFATDGSGYCTDSDGKNNFNQAGYVNIDGGTQSWDYCNRDIAYDYYCCDYAVDSNCAGGIPGSLNSFLPITGAVTVQGNFVPATTSKDCTTLGVSCTSGGICGCTPGQIGTPSACSNGNVCEYGTTTCNPQGTDYECIGAVYPGDKCSNGLNCTSTDNNGDGLGDCTQKLNQCIDFDEDGYGTSSDQTGCAGHPLVDCNDNNNATYPGATEICGDGIDNNCDGVIDEAGCILTETCDNDGIKEGTELCDGSQLGGKTCVTQGFKSGTLTCTSTCTFNTSGCTNIDIILPPCTDDDGDGYIAQTDAALCNHSLISNYHVGKDNDDTNSATNPGASEICDAKDNNQNGNIDDGIVYSEIVLCINDNDVCGTAPYSCVNGEVKNTCASFGYHNPGSTEIDGDGIDNNCDGVIDEGSDCTEDQDCTPSQSCKLGVQRCESGILSSTCEVTGDDSDCNVDTTCNGQFVTSCGTNVGLCQTGSKYCQIDGTWGTCDDVKPVTEICTDTYDNDCDGLTDLEDSECSGANYDNNQTNNTNNSNQVGETEKSKSIFQKIINLFLAILQVGKIATGGTLNANVVSTVVAPCTDSDGGVNYFVKGSGSGISNKIEIYFQDTCYENSINNQVGSCAGENCFLSEKSCEGTQVKTESQVKCQYGCVKGACVPESKAQQGCTPYFDKDLFDWVNSC